jgi:hypothetical protein
MKPMTLVQTAVAAVMILGRTPLTFANGGLVMVGASDSKADFDEPDLFAMAASAAWTRGAPNMCREFESFMQQITTCDGLDLDVRTGTLNIQTGTPLRPDRPMQT